MKTASDLLVEATPPLTPQTLHRVCISRGGECSVFDPKQPQTISFGCRLNSYESAVMRDHAAAAGLGDAIIVNTCTVTAEAERQARQTIRRLRRENPQAKIIVTGCAVQVHAEVFAAMPEIDHLIGNDVKLDAATYQGLTQRVLVNDIQGVKDLAAHLVTGFEHGPRGFVQVQNGCDHRCTFCIIPFGRGASRSVPVGGIVDQVRSLVTAGYQEIVLTGVDLTSYGADLPGQPRLGQMVRRLLALVPELPRLRLSSLDPAEMDEDLWHLIAQESRLMPHLHFSLQAGDDMVLKRMKRRHSREQAIAVCQQVRALRPDVVLGADLIAGFPTEDEAMFRQTYDLVTECDLTWLHVFPYSARSGTPAAKMPQVPVAVRKERAARLRQLAQQQVEKHLRQMQGCVTEILVEQAGIGRTPHYAELRFEGDAPRGALVKALVTGQADDHLIGVLQ